MEIARYACRHCPTCSGRLDYVRRRLNGEAEWDYVEGGVVVKLPYPKGRSRSESSVAGFLQQKIGLPIAAVA